MGTLRKEGQFYDWRSSFYQEDKRNRSTACVFCNVWHHLVSQEKGAYGIIFVVAQHPILCLMFRNEATLTLFLNVSKYLDIL